MQLKSSFLFFSNVFATNGLSPSSPFFSSLCPAVALPYMGRHFPEAFDVYLTFDVVAVCPRAGGPIKTSNHQGPPTLPRTLLPFTHFFVLPITFSAVNSWPLATVHFCSCLTSFMILPFGFFRLHIFSLQFAIHP